MTTDRQWELIREDARKVAAAAPPLTQDQAERLAILFGPITPSATPARPAVEVRDDAKAA